jgi:hypothetical protein
MASATGCNLNWKAIRVLYPEQWLLVEAIDAHSKSDRRMLDELSVVESFQDSTIALQQYARLHHEAPNRELYVFHTSREDLDIVERQWLGMRLAG